MLVDTHAHLNFSAYKNDLDETIGRALSEKIWIINVGSQYKTSKKAVEIAEKYKEGVFAAIGLHPIYSTPDLIKIKTDPKEGNLASKGEIFQIDKYRKLAESKKVVAIGEIGLDYYNKPKTKRKISLFKEKQKEIFLKQLELARNLNLPIIFHCRMAHNDLLNILKLKSGLRGVIHCFTGSWREAKEYLTRNFYLGFNGIIFKLDLDEVIKKTPLNRILVETDCPYLTPPLAGRERNEPVFVKYVVQKIADLKGVNFKKVAEITTENARVLFKI